jgi:Fic-DOC domain mobile mystery protein B
VTEEPPFGLRTIGPEPDGATPLEHEDLKGLIPDFVATRADLNQVEYENIAKALPWAQRQARLRGTAGLLEYAFLFALHREMFGDVWRWAGTQRQRVTNIGVDPSQIPDETRRALDDAKYWHDNNVFSIDERAARLHYRLVSVHPFPNGNGRATRLIADLYLASVGATPFTWGASRLDTANEARKVYIQSLIAAQMDGCASLVTFART